MAGKRGREREREREGKKVRCDKYVGRSVEVRNQRLKCIRGKV